MRPLRRFVPLVLVAGSLLGCSTLQDLGAASTAADLPALRSAARRLPVPSADTLFALDPAFERELRSPEWQQLPTARRLERLLATLYGPAREPFLYDASGSTTAAETWRRRRGDCLSLAVLTYASARVLGLTAQLQEVQVPRVLERRGRYDYVNFHVNVRVRVNSRDALESPHTKDVTIDFDPETANAPRGRPITEAAILARYDNNIGVGLLAHGDRAGAYAHLQAALAADPTFGATYLNLAVLAREEGAPAAAERWLREALARGDEHGTALAALHDLLVAQGRVAEAEPLARELAAWRSADPAHWIETGRAHLAAGEPRRAAVAFERALTLTAGRADLHRLLAAAYRQSGQPELAQQQMARAQAVEGGTPVMAKWKGKSKPAP